MGHKFSFTEVNVAKAIGSGKTGKKQRRELIQNQSTFLYFYESPLNVEAISWPNVGTFQSRLLFSRVFGKFAALAPNLENIVSPREDNEEGFALGHTKESLTPISPIEEKNVNRWNK